MPPDGRDHSPAPIDTRRERGPAHVGDDDEVLLIAVGGGDFGTPLRELYARYAHRVYLLGVHLLGESGLAEELVQETFMRLWRSAGLFDPKRGTAKTFVFTIARRQAIDLWRRASSRPFVAYADENLSVSGGVQSLDSETERLANRLDLSRALSRLPEPQRAVLELTYFGQLKQSEIADCLGIPIGTVKSRSFSGLQALKRVLEDPRAHE